MAKNSHHSQQTSSVKESVSALVDGEVSEMELHRLLKASETDGEVRETWSRYQLASSAIRGDLAVAPMIDLSASISEAIEQEETYKVAPKATGWLQNAGRMAVAASVAAVMVVTVQMVGLGGDNIDQQVADSGEVSSSEELLVPNPAVNLPAGFQVPSVSARTVSSHPRMPAQEASPRYYPVVTKAQPMATTKAPAPEVQTYLQRVMEIHADHAALNSSRGMLPYARVPVTETPQQ